MSLDALREFIVPPQQRALLDYWLRIRGDRRMPGRADIRPDEIDASLLPHVGLIDVIGHGDRFRYRLVGTAMNRLYARNYTGQYVDAAKAPEYASVLVDEYRACAREAAIRAFTAVQRYAGGFTRRSDRLLLPLSADGVSVDMILFSTMADAAEQLPPATLRSLTGDAVVAIERGYRVCSVPLPDLPPDGARRA